MKTGEGLRSEALVAALDEAIAGRDTQLFKLLGIASGLPGPRMNIGVALGFANECAMRGAAADALVHRMASLDAKEAPGATPLEFLPVCGVLGLGARAAKADAKMRRATLADLETAAADLRFRVREAAAIALARVGSAAGDEIVAEVASFMDGFFQAAAVLRALADPQWLSAIDDGDAIVLRLDQAFALAESAPRSAVRWPGWKALHEELGRAPSKVAARFGSPVFDLLVRWASVTMPELREVVEANLRDGRVLSRFAPEVERVRAALAASAPVARDPRSVVPGTRRRGGRRGRR